MENNIELKLIGITYNQIESGVYALVLEDTVMKRRLAIVIGYPEAQSIECKLQNVRTPRPLTHDLFVEMLKRLNVCISRVDIHRLPSGPYAGKITLTTLLGETFEIDARSSDAIAIAIRMNAPIYTSKELLEKEGYSPSGVKNKNDKKADKVKESIYRTNYTDMELRAMLEKCVSEENYEEAAEIKKELERRRNTQKSDLEGL